MSQVTARQAASRTRQQPGAVSPAQFGFGLLPAIILVLAVISALVHLDKALTLGFPFGHPVGIQFGMGGSMRAAGAGAHGAMPGGMPAPGASGTAGRPPAGQGPSLPVPLPVLFFLNFLGYAVLIAALYLPVPVLQRYRSITRWVLVAFAAITIWGYFAIVGDAPYALGAFDKAVEISLILFLLIEVYYLHVTRGQPGASGS